MPSFCTAYNCSNNSDTGYALVRYPHDDTLKRKWIAAVGRGKNWSPSSSQRLCEVHFKPSEIEFVAGRKRVKLGSVPSRFCTCRSEDQQKPLIALAVNNRFSRKRCLRNELETLVQHQYGCVQNCKPLTKKCIQTTAKSQEIAEQIDKMQPMNKNVDLLRSIVDENKQLRNEVKGTVEKVDKKTEKIDLEDVVRKVHKENYELKQQVEILSKRIQLTEKVLAEDQWKAFETGQSKGIKWSNETILKSLGLRFTCGTTGYNYIREVLAPFPSVRTLQRSVKNISFEPGLDRYFRPT